MFERMEHQTRSTHVPLLRDDVTLGVTWIFVDALLRGDESERRLGLQWNCLGHLVEEY